MRAGYLAGRKHAPESLGRVLVLGLGKSGKACVEYLRPLLGRRVEALAVGNIGDACIEAVAAGRPAAYGAEVAA